MIDLLMGLYELNLSRTAETPMLDADSASLEGAESMLAIGHNEESTRHAGWSSGGGQEP